MPTRDQAQVEFHKWARLGVGGQCLHDGAVCSVLSRCIFDDIFCDIVSHCTKRAGCAAFLRLLRTSATDDALISPRWKKITQASSFAYIVSLRKRQASLAKKRALLQQQRIQRRQQAEKMVARRQSGQIGSSMQVC